MTRKRLKLGQMLLEAGLIDEFQLNSALSHQRNCGGGRLGASLVKLRYITEGDLLSFLSEQLNLPRVDLARRRIPPDVLACIPAEKAWEFKAIPVDRKELHGTVHLLVAMVDPADSVVIDALQRMTGCRVRPALVFESALIEALVNGYGPLVTEEEEFQIEIAPDPQEGAAPLDFPGLIPRPRPVTVEEKLQKLLKILLDRGILSMRDFERLK